jgi:hypothetical protein
MKSIKDYLPKKQETVLMQARVPESLAQKVRVVLKKEHISLTDLFEAMLNRFLDEMEKKK